MQETADVTKGDYTYNGHGDMTSNTDSQGQLLNEYTYDYLKTIRVVFPLFRRILGWRNKIAIFTSSSL